MLTVVMPESAAAMTAISALAATPFASGRTMMSTPMKPAATADQRRRRTIRRGTAPRDRHEQRRRIRERDRLRERQMHDRPEARHHAEHADHAARDIKAELVGDEQIAPPRAISGNANIAPKRLRKKAISNAVLLA